MSYDPMGVVNNARLGKGPCSECPATEGDTECSTRRANYPHPGYFNAVDPPIIFVGIEPTHRAPSHYYESFEKYSKKSGEGMFLQPDKGGRALAQTLQLISNVGITDTFVTDSIKCPPEGDTDTPRPEEFDYCQHYLEEEIGSFQPDAFVVLGKIPRDRMLRTLGNASQIDQLNKDITKDVGRIIHENPTVISAVNWSHGHLRRRPNSDWGSGWLEDADYLPDQEFTSNIQILQYTLRHVSSD
ncbi:uracil-DNA glycosylase family protein [Haloarchaeobius sp. TZWSO28]|uniref:uracil-DNA glycosylase family protein n=1 Tax=Haloarchaeobius sp. TZWSO28 TaxID=3446119 RepID=UPI003EBC2920